MPMSGQCTPNCPTHCVTPSRQPSRNAGAVPFPSIGTVRSDTMTADEKALCPSVRLGQKKLSGTGDAASIQIDPIPRPDHSVVTLENGVMLHDVRDSPNSCDLETKFTPFSWERGSSHYARLARRRRSKPELVDKRPQGSGSGAFSFAAEDHSARGVPRSCDRRVARMSTSTSGVPLHTLGCCAMPSKLTSIPMRTILQTLAEVGNFQLIQFTEEQLVHQSVTEWPRVDCLIAFHSRGYPLEKVAEYARLHNPVILNDIGMQSVLRDRIEVIKRLDSANIPSPRHMRVDHLAVKRGEAQFEEYDDYFIYNGVRMDKPFIEKPVDADDHNNYVYYPKNAGGGCKKLFRKLANRSSEYYSDITRIRRDNVYLYEEFLPTWGTDIKVYTVGPMFAHAEARKAPTLDGRVQRTAQGKEERYPVLLSDEEKWIAYMVVEVFKQTVCGFDILRTTSGKAVVCDVNGWSFVKGNQKYYSDAAHLIAMMFRNALRRRRGYVLRHTPGVVFGHCSRPRCLLDEVNKEDIMLGMRQLGGGIIDVGSSGNLEDEPSFRDELQSIVVVMRHGDRSPKQKMKFVTKSPLILEFFHHRQNKIGKVKVVKLRTSEDLKEFQALNDKILMTQLTAEARENHRRVKAILSTQELIEITRKVQLVIPKDAKLNQDGVTEVRVVLKWGGELTPLGLVTSEALGHQLRERLYPNDHDGLLRLHSTFRHDFKIYTSDEGRCQLTAAAFTKGFLDLDGDLPPILVQMVTRDEVAQELFEEGQYTKTVKSCKQFIQRIVHLDLGPQEMCTQIFQPVLKTSCLVCDNIVTLSRVPCSSPYSSKGERGYPTFGRAIPGVVSDPDVPLPVAEAASSSSSSAAGDNSQIAEDLAAQGETTEGPLSGETPAISIESSNATVTQRLLAEYHRVLAQIGPLWSRCRQIHQDITVLVAKLEACLAEMDSDSNCQDSAAMRRRLGSIYRRWKSLDTAWWRSQDNQPIDATKIPEVYDNARYDLLHGQVCLVRANAVADVEKVFRHIEHLGPFVFSLEFGITPEEKVEIGSKTVPKLIKKIADDLIFHHKRALELENQNLSSTTAVRHSSQTSPTGAKGPTCALTFEALDSGADANGIRTASSAPTGAAVAAASSMSTGLASGTRGANRTPSLTAEDARRSTTTTTSRPSVYPDFEEDREHIILFQEEARKMGIKSPWRKVRSRYYAASASHVMSLLNVLTYAAETSMVEDRRHNGGGSSSAGGVETVPALFPVAAGGGGANHSPVTLRGGDTNEALNKADSLIDAANLHVPVAHFAQHSRTSSQSPSEGWPGSPKTASIAAATPPESVRSFSKQDPISSTVSMVGEKRMAGRSETKPNCGGPLNISAMDTPYLSHLVIRVWRPAGKMAGCPLDGMKVEVSWNKGSSLWDPEPCCANSLNCSVLDMYDLLRLTTEAHRDYGEEFPMPSPGNITSEAASVASWTAAAVGGETASAEERATSRSSRVDLPLI